MARKIKFHVDLNIWTFILHIWKLAILHVFSKCFIDCPAGDKLEAIIN